MTKAQITIGIPAYNEAANIGNLLADLFHQQTQSCVVQKIIIVSDASTDATIAEINSFASDKIDLISNKKRQGKAAALNKISSLTATPILVFLDADIRLPSSGFLDKLVLPIIKNQADLVSADLVEAPPTNFFEKVLYASSQVKKDIFNSYQNGQNFFTCHGPARAFSRSLYQSLRFKYSIGEDLYSYVFCQIHGFKYQFVPDAYSIYRLPGNYLEHERQSIRFSQAVSKINSEFGYQKVKNLTKIPWVRVVYWTLVHLFRHPVYILSNIFIFAIARARSLFIDHTQDAWFIADSSKKINAS